MAKIGVHINDIRRWTVALLCGQYQIVGTFSNADPLRAPTSNLPDLIANGNASIHPEENVVRIEVDTINKAQDMILSCEGCDADAEILFSEILDRVMGSDHTVTDYLLKKPGRCPACLGAITVTTFVQPDELRLNSVVKDPAAGSPSDR